jgi:Flp pilus assembly protein TadG
MNQAGAPRSNRRQSKMIRRWKAIRGEEGSSFVELMLVIAFLILPLMVGMTGFGILVYDYIEVSDAAEAGASYASEYFRTNSAFPTNAATVAQAAEANIPSASVSIPAVYCGCSSAGSTSAVTGSCSSVTAASAATCTGNGDIEFVTVTTNAAVDPVGINLTKVGVPSTAQINGSATFELAP